MDKLYFQVMTKTPTLDSLRSFVVFADKLNFTHAAEALHISQPALHVKINELGETLGVPLYIRSGRGLELTEHGKKVARFGREIEDRLDVFMQELSGEKVMRPIVLAAGEGTYQYLLADAIQEFTRRGRDRLKLLTADREGIIEAIGSGRADLGVAPLETTPHGFTAVPLKKVTQVLVMPRDHYLAKKKSIKLADLSGEKLIVPPSNRPHRQMLSMALQSAGVEWEVAVEAQGWELMLRFVQLKLGLAVVHSSCTIPRTLVTRPIPSLPNIHYHLLHLIGTDSRSDIARLKSIVLTMQ